MDPLAGSQWSAPRFRGILAGESFVFTQFSGEPQCFLTEQQLDAKLARAGFVRDSAAPFHEYNLGMLMVPISVLGYGYWLGVSHGSLSVYVTDVSNRQLSRPVLSVALVFLNAEGRALAEARAAEPLGTVYLSSPAPYSYWDVEQRAPFSVEARNEWDQCSERLSRWIPMWIKSVRYIDLRSGPCSLRNTPASVSENPDTWWLWWVPMRHVGGKPYRNFSVSIQVDINSCALST